MASGLSGIPFYSRSQVCPRQTGSEGEGSEVGAGNERVQVSGGGGGKQPRNRSTISGDELK